MPETAPEKDYARLLLSALFHDIGKFAHRVGEGSGRHEERATSIVNNSFKNTNEQLSFLEVLNGSPDSDLLARLFRIADNMTAMQREIIDEKRSVQRIPLRSIFSDKSKVHKNISDNLNDTFMSSMYLDDLTDFSFDKLRFNEFIRQLDKLDEEYKEKLREANKETFNELIDEILSVFRNFLYAIPDSAHATESTISLYAHTKIVTALSAALYLRHIETGEDFVDLRNALNDTYRKVLKVENSSRETGQHIEKLLEEIYNATERNASPMRKKIFLHIEGDFSGIQDFVYNIVSKSAAKHLRARSYLLWALNKICAAYICEQLGLSPANVLFASGGHFLILAHNTSNTQDKIKELSNYINEKLLDIFGGKVFLSIKITEMFPDEYSRYYPTQKNKKEVKIADKLAKFNNLLSEEFFLPRYSSANRELKECQICKSLKNVTRRISDGEEEWICSTCSSIEELGQKIKRFSRMGGFDMLLTGETSEISQLKNYFPSYLTRKNSCLISDLGSGKHPVFSWDYFPIGLPTEIPKNEMEDGESSEEGYKVLELEKIAEKSIYV
ncbi:hypothetical protein D6817_02520, partial [Candidatus Pacearchaeota archaeon]